LSKKKEHCALEGSRFTEQFHFLFILCVCVCATFSHLCIGQTTPPPLCMHFRYPHLVRAIGCVSGSANFPKMTERRKITPIFVDRILSKLRYFFCAFAERAKRPTRSGTDFTANAQEMKSTTLCWATADSSASTRARASPTPVSIRTESKSIATRALEAPRVRVSEAA